MDNQPDFLAKPLEDLTNQEWESLCDGCGLCCQHRANHPDTGVEVRTNFACSYLNLETLGCNAYHDRLEKVSYCFQLTAENIRSIPYLPQSCAYRLVAEGKPLPDWHHLVCGDREEVHRRNISKRGELLPDSELIRWIEQGKKDEDKPDVRFYDM